MKGHAAFHKCCLNGYYFKKSDKSQPLLCALHLSVFGGNVCYIICILCITSDCMSQMDNLKCIFFYINTFSIGKKKTHTAKSIKKCTKPGTFKVPYGILHVKYC